MRIVHISDTHGRHREIEGLPEGDVIVHSGDFTNMGTEEEVLDFLNWMVAIECVLTVGLGWGVWRRVKTLQH